MIFDYLSRYFTFISVLVAFFAGWYSGYTYYNVKQLKIDLNSFNQEIKTKDRLLATTNQNIQNINKQSIIDNQQKAEIKQKLEEQIKLNADYKNYINAHNIITHDVMQRVGALRIENAKLRAHATIASNSSATYATVSAYDYVQWATGLKAHDDTCVVAFNNLQTLYNKEMLIVNGFK